MLSVIIHLLKVMVKFFRFCSLNLLEMKEQYTYQLKQSAGWGFTFMVPKPVENHILISHLIQMYFKTKQAFQGKSWQCPSFC